jgi:hypothetical protein
MIPVVGIYAFGWSAAISVFNYWFDGLTPARSQDSSAAAAIRRGFGNTILAIQHPTGAYPEAYLSGTYFTGGYSH